MTDDRLMSLGATELNRSTLQRQLLLHREQIGVPAAVRVVVGLQAQEPVSPYIALWNRVEGFAPSDLDEALTAAAVIKATLMRITLHLVHHDDWSTFRAAVLPVLRGARLGDQRFTSAGQSVADVDAVLGELDHFTAQPRTAKEVEGFVEATFGAAATKGVWWALRTYAPLRRTPTGGPWSFDGPAIYASGAAGLDLGLGRDEAARALARRYLAGFGPATVRDFAQFCLIDQSTARQALTPDDLVYELEQDDGPPVYDLRACEVTSGDAPASPRLLGMWDNVLLAYQDRSRIIPEQYRQAVLRRNGNVLPVLLVDGHVAGVWRSIQQGQEIECTAFETLPDHVWHDLEREARSLRTLLRDRDPQPYRRYDHWWQKGLPATQVRTLTT